MCDSYRIMLFCVFVSSMNVHGFKSHTHTPMILNDASPCVPSTLFHHKSDNNSLTLTQVPMYVVCAGRSTSITTAFRHTSGHTEVRE